MPFEKLPNASQPTHPALFRAGAGRLPILMTLSLPSRNTCRIVRQLVSEMVVLLGDRVMPPRDRRRPSCHVRQIAMYVCHVSLRMSLSDIGDAFGRDRTTVGHACHVVEDRRDDPAFDDFVSAVERIVAAVFGLSEMSAHD
ncbi:helix-turn-helix domain-containing protein [Rhizobium sp. LC145]|jgi:hypothetical protein|uniref:helix-turn-helix domain-containing protein n=1 Tax=Rhizobium sp. LC145 TaxID=1120688 RepID=UPI001FDA73E3|nr:helix-turn-helix domain-containing protein [Rhizobium sp. LC145]